MENLIAFFSVVIPILLVLWMLWVLVKSVTRAVNYEHGPPKYYSHRKGEVVFYILIVIVLMVFFSQYSSSVPKRHLNPVNMELNERKATIENTPTLAPALSESDRKTQERINRGKEIYDNSSARNSEENRKAVEAFRIGN